MKFTFLNGLILLQFIFTNYFAQNISNLIQKGDSLIINHFDYHQALDFYNQALKLDPNNIALLNKVSKTIVSVGDNLYNSVRGIEDEYRFGDKMDKESLDSTEIEGAQTERYENALIIAEKTVRLDPQNAEGYVRRAIANARIAVTKGIFSVASIVNKVKDDLEFAIKLGTGGNDVQAIAHYVLAKTHDEVSEKWAPARSIIGLGWGDIKIALAEYKKAIELKSDVIMFYLDYAKALLEEDEKHEAKLALEKIDYCEILEPADKNRIVEAKNLLTNLD